MAVPLADLDRADRQARAARALARGEFCSTNITWNSGVAAESRSGCSSSTSLLERQVLVGVGAQGHLAHPRQQLAERGSPDRSARSTRVLTKKPISPSISAAVAVGDRRADQQVVCPV